MIVAIFAPLIATHDPRQANVVERLQGSSAEHYLGTDGVGRDLFSRIVHGTRISLKVGFMATAFSLGFGTLFGAIAGYYGGWLDNVIMRAMDIMLVMPSILLAMVIVTIFRTESHQCDYCGFHRLYSAVCAHPPRLRAESAPIGLRHGRQSRRC